jgi:ABC-2 type transport system permease protein
LPFKYLAYTPSAIMLGRYEHAEMARELAVALAWVVGLFLLNRIAFARGVRRYGAFGG